MRNLPAYLFGRINELKYRKRKAGIDVIDLREAGIEASPDEDVIEPEALVRGDPKLVLERMWLLLRRVQQAGVREIRGDIVLDRSAFAPVPFDPARFDNDPRRVSDRIALRKSGIDFAGSPVTRFRIAIMGHQSVIPDWNRLAPTNSVNQRNAGWTYIPSRTDTITTTTTTPAGWSSNRMWAQDFSTSATVTAMPRKPCCSRGRACSLASSARRRSSRLVMGFPLLVLMHPCTKVSGVSRCIFR